MRNSTGKTDTYLNVGCGERFHPAWINIDFDGTAEQVIRVDLRQGIPFPSTSFDVVYHSHLLEHFTKFAAEHFLKECYRVLVAGGIIRVVVPDLEQIQSRWKSLQARFALYRSTETYRCSSTLKYREKWIAGRDGLILSLPERAETNAASLHA